MKLFRKALLPSLGLLLLFPSSAFADIAPPPELVYGALAVFLLAVLSIIALITILIIYFVKKRKK